MGKGKTKRKNLKRELAKKSYLDPKSSTFLKKSKSLEKAGFEKSYADTGGMKMLDNSNFTPADYRKIELYVSDLPQIQSLLSQVHKDLKASGSISAKSHANLIKELETKAKMLGILKTYIEKREMVVHVTLPSMVCPECGHKYDIMAKEYEGGDKL